MLSPPLQDTRFRVSGEQAEKLVSEFGTPLYVLDEGRFRARIRAYRRAFEKAAPGSEISFAAKANSTLALLAIAHAEGCGIDVASEGELRAALAAGVPASQCHSHGNNKSRAELAFAIERGVAHIVVDNFNEIEAIAELQRLGRPRIVLRLAPGVDPITHHKISTGQADTKFGFNIADGSAEKATRRCLDLNLDLIGYHCHVGSQLIDPEAQRSGGELIARFAADMRGRHDFATKYLNVGGGLGVRYTESDHPTAIDDYCRLVAEAVLNSLHGTGLTPVLAQEPGRSLAAESGVTLYQVGPIKTVPIKGSATRTYVVVDGGLADNPRPAMYGSRYTVERVHPAPGRELQTVTVSGRHCETDKLFEDVQLPANLATGDVLQVLCTGGYNSSMASNYNRYPRPAAVLIRENGRFDLVQRRESWEEMLAREMVPGDLLPG